MRGNKIRGGIIFGVLAHIDVMLMEGNEKIVGLDGVLKKGG